MQIKTQKQIPDLLKLMQVAELRQRGNATPYDANRTFQLKKINYKISLYYTL
ncbi:MAG: hypothetical protein QM800_01660 [Paludibacter sp.]